MNLTSSESKVVGSILRVESIYTEVYTRSVYKYIIDSSNL
jgi:hypothetical protein